MVATSLRGGTGGTRGPGNPPGCSAVASPLIGAVNPGRLSARGAGRRHQLRPPARAAFVSEQPARGLGRPGGPMARGLHHPTAAVPPGAGMGQGPSQRTPRPTRARQTPTVPSATAKGSADATQNATTARERCSQPDIPVPGDRKHWIPGDGKHRNSRDGKRWIPGTENAGAHRMESTGSQGMENAGS